MRSRAGIETRGSISVEFALATPIIVVLVLGGVYLSMALSTRHSLAEATSLATREAAIVWPDEGSSDPEPTAGEIGNLIEERMGGSLGNCASMNVNRSVVNGLGGVRRLEVIAECFLVPPFGADLLGGDLGLGSVRVLAAMPIM